MGNEGRPIRAGEPLPLPEPGAAELLDPIALEERLKEARARRAAALAGRRSPARPPRPDFAEAASAFLREGEAPAPATPSVETLSGRQPTAPAPEAAVTRLPAAPLSAAPSEPAAAAPPPADSAPAVEPPLRPLVRVPVWAIFLTGLALGAAVVAIAALAPTMRQPTAAEHAAADPSPSTASAPPAVAKPAPPGAATTAAAVAPAVAPAVAVEPAAPSPAVAARLPLPAQPPVAVAATQAPQATEQPPADLAPPASEAAVPASLRAAAPPAPARPVGAPRPRATAASPSPAAPLAEEVGPLPERVTIHYPPSAAAEAERASAMLAAAGVTRVGTIPVRLDISRSNVRFYHTGDGAAAGTVAALLGAGGEAPLTRDFTDYKTPAAAGTLEVWLAGDGGPAPPTRPRRAPETGPATGPATGSSAAPATAEPALPIAGTLVPDPGAPLPEPTAAPTPLGPQDQAQAVARIIVERAYERLMRAVPGH